MTSEIFEPWPNDWVDSVCCNNCRDFNHVLTHFGLGRCYDNEGGIELLEGEFVAYPVRNKATGRLAWQLTRFVHVPGRWNPYDGGTPPDVDETEVGVFGDVFQIARAIMLIDLDEKIVGLQESMEQEKMGFVGEYDNG